MHGGIGGDGMIGALHWAHERMCSVFLDGEGTETRQSGKIFKAQRVPDGSNKHDTISGLTVVLFARTISCT